MEKQRTDQLSSGQTAECFYLMCDRCMAANCACFCHTKRSNFYERFTKKEIESKPVMMNNDPKPLRGRPPKAIVGDGI